MTQTLTAAAPASTSIARPTTAERLFCELLDRHLDGGWLRFLTPAGEHEVGPGRRDGTAPVATIRVAEPRFFARVLAEGNLGMGESFMDRHFDVEDGALQDVLTLLLRSRLDRKVRHDWQMAMKVLALRLVHTLRGKQHNVQSHYDTGNDLFEAFLDPTLTYSCGYARSPADSLEALQFQKLDRICRKLRLEPGQRLLDIGCGFGGLLAHAATHYGVTGIGVTISREHCNYGNARLARAGLSDRARIEFEDHTKIRGTFDRVVSVGMLEHVPRREYRRYFDNIARVLTPDGLGLVHAIGCISAKNEHDPFIQKYIFPGSNTPKLSEIAENLERHELAIVDVENIVRHYSHTCERWLENFHANRATLDAARYNDRFLRMWEYYLCAGIAAARASNSSVFQVLFIKDYAAALPLARV